MSVPDISVEVAKKVTAIGQEMKSRAARGSRALKNAELQVLRGQRGGRSYKNHLKEAATRRLHQANRQQYAAENCGAASDRWQDPPAGHYP